MSEHSQNVSKLIAVFIARHAIPPGGGLADGIKFLKNPEWRKQVYERAEADAVVAIQAIRSAPDNPYGNDDDIIAGVLLEKIEERKREQAKK